MNCPTCNAPIIDGAAFCGNCGSPVSVAQPDQASQQPGWQGGQQAQGGQPAWTQGAPSGGQPEQQVPVSPAEGAVEPGKRIPKKALIIGGAAAVVVVLVVALLPAFMGRGSSSVSMYVSDTLQTALQALGVDGSIDAGANVTGRKDIAVSDFGYTVGDDGYVSCACMVENPNDEFVAQSVEVTFTGYDSSGKAVYQEVNHLSYILPNQIVGAACPSYQEAKGVESMECSVSVADEAWVHVRNIPVDDSAGMFEFLDVEENFDEYGTFMISGTLQNNTESLFRGAQVNGVMRNSAGEIVGGVSGYLSGSLASSGGTNFFELGFYNDVPAFSTCSLYVMPT